MKTVLKPNYDNPHEIVYDEYIGVPFSLRLEVEIVAGTLAAKVGRCRD